MGKKSIVINEDGIKKIRDEYFVNSSQLSVEESSLAKKERNDCVVRAFMFALGVSYESAHKWVKKYLKREDRKGTYTTQYVKNIIGKTKNHNRISLYGVAPKYRIGRLEKSKKLTNKNYKKSANYTVKAFMENHPQGKYVIIVRGHALALVDGVLYGNPEEQYKGFKRYIRFVIKVGK